MIESEPKLWIPDLTRFLLQINLCNLRKLDCQATRYPLARGRYKASQLLVQANRRDMLRGAI
jgi:hypothetical protein